MFAAVMHLTIARQAPAAASAFSEVLLPRVASSDGFIAGYWVDPVEGQGLGFVLFATAEQAKAAMPPETDWSAPGVAIGRVDIRRVAASA